MPFLLALALATLASAPKNDAAWAASLKPGETVTLPAGIYRGPWKLGTGVHLIALPGAILERGNPVLSIAGDAVIVEGLTVRATPDGVGISALDSTDLLLREVTVLGGMRAVSARRGSITWRGGGIENSLKFGIWIQGCHADISDLKLLHNQGSALYIGHGSARLSDLTISGAEYGLLAFASQIELTRSHFSKIRRAGAGLVVSSGSISQTELEGPFGEAGIATSGARPLFLRGNQIRHAGSVGIKLNNSAATLSQNEISGARSDGGGLEGDGLYSNNSQVESTSDRLFDNGGAAISIMGGKAAFQGCQIQGSGQAAVSVAEHGELSLSGCRIWEGSTALMIAPGAIFKNEAVDQ